MEHLKAETRAIRRIPGAPDVVVELGQICDFKGLWGAMAPFEGRASAVI
jgi:hypothetical protein